MKTANDRHPSMSAARERPEHEMLFLCARTQASAEECARIESLAGEGLDWDYLLEIARSHSVHPLLFRQLNNCVAHEMPAGFLARLKNEFQANVARNMLLTGELLRLLAALKALGVEAVPFKGPALAAYAYGDIGLRSFSDLDVLVLKRDVPLAKEIILSLGFEPGLRLTDAQEAMMLRTQHNLPFVREGGRILVELHWEVVPEDFSGAFKAKDLMRDLGTIKLQKVEVNCLSPELLLLSLCIHGAKHLWERLAWVCDINEIIRTRTEIDWPRLLETAARSDTERMLDLGLRLAKETLGAPLPKMVEERVWADASVERLARQVRQNLARRREGSPSPLRSLAFNLRARKSLRDKLRYFRLTLTPTDADLSALSLPASLSFVYYLLRPFRMLRKQRQRRQPRPL